MAASNYTEISTTLTDVTGLLLGRLLACNGDTNACRTTEVQSKERG